MATEKRLIDANALKLKAWPESETGEGIVYVEDIDDAPTVDAVPVVHGWWIPCENGGYYCSNCDRRAAFLVHNRYCPNCGAKMDGEKEKQ